MFRDELNCFHFKELDNALKRVAKEQEEAEAVSVEVTIPRKNRRARSLSRNNTETLPDEVTFFLSLLFSCLIHRYLFLAIIFIDQRQVYTYYLL